VSTPMIEHSLALAGNLLVIPIDASTTVSTIMPIVLWHVLFSAFTSSIEQQLLLCLLPYVKYSYNS
jgi:hypothetical protein